MVGPRGAHARRPRRRPRRHGAQRCPSHARQGLHASESDLQWFSSGYLLVLAAAMLPLGLLGDRYGRKKVMLGRSPLRRRLGGAAPTPGLGRRVHRRPGAARRRRRRRHRDGALGTHRALQRGGAAKGRRRVGGANFVAFPSGPILGGWLLATTGGAGCSCLNVPVALVGLGGHRDPRAGVAAAHPPRARPVGIVLSVAGLVGVTYGLIRGRRVRLEPSRRLAAHRGRAGRPRRASSPGSVA